MSWQVRITGYADVDPRTLAAHPLNFRVHGEKQLAVVSGLIEQLGWLDEVVVSERTSRILNGHARVKLAIDKGEPTVPVSYVSVDEAEESLILSTFDPVAASAGIDAHRLKLLAKTVQAEDDAVKAMLADQEADADRMIALLDRGTQTGSSDGPSSPEVKPPKKLRPVKLVFGPQIKIKVPGAAFDVFRKQLKEKFPRTEDAIKELVRRLQL